MLFSLSFRFTLWLARTAKSTIWHFFIIITRSGRLSMIRWFVYISKSHMSLLGCNIVKIKVALVLPVKGQIVPQLLQKVMALALDNLKTFLWQKTKKPNRKHFISSFNSLNSFHFLKYFFPNYFLSYLSFQLFSFDFFSSSFFPYLFTFSLLCSIFFLFLCLPVLFTFFLFFELSRFFLTSDDMRKLGIYSLSSPANHQHNKRINTISIYKHK